MSRVTKTTAYTGAVLALALTLTGCNGGGQPSNNSTSCLLYTSPSPRDRG